MNSTARALHNPLYSEKLSIRKTKEKGRFVQAKSTIQKGELILVEKSQAAVPIFTQEFIPFCCRCFTSIYLGDYFSKIFGTLFMKI